MDRPVDALPLARLAWLAQVGLKVGAVAMVATLGIIFGVSALTREGPIDSFARRLSGPDSVSVTTVRTVVPVGFGSFSVDRVRRLRGVAVPPKLATSAHFVVLEVGVTLTNLSDQPVTYSSLSDFQLQHGRAYGASAFAHSTKAGRIEEMRARKILLYYAVDRRDREPLAFSFFDPTGSSVRVDLGRLSGIAGVRVTPYGHGHHH